MVIEFLPAFQVTMPEERLKSLFDYMNHIMPPLSDWQIAQLSICLPLFSATLKSNDLPSDLKGKLVDFMRPLANFALDSQNYPRARSDSALCLFWIIARHQVDEIQVCLSNRLLQKTIFPEIQTRLQILQDPQRGLNSDNADYYKDALNLASLVVSYRHVK
jgi:hypothetical protein